MPRKKGAPKDITKIDDLANVRDVLEAKMKVINAEHHERCSAMPDAIEESHAIWRADTAAAYAWAKANKGKSAETDDEEETDDDDA